MKHGRFPTLPVGLLVLLALSVLGVSMVSAQVPSAGSIGGNVYCDANHNFSFDPGEGVSGVAVTLYDDGDCTWPYTDTLRTSQDSGIDGVFHFSDLLAGGDFASRVCYGVEVDTSALELGQCNFLQAPNPWSVWLYDPYSIATVDFRFTQIWEKTVNGQPWVPDLVVTAETSDTIEVVDIINPTLEIDRTVDANGIGETILVETWNPDELALVDYVLTYGDVLTDTGVLTWTIPTQVPVQDVDAPLPTLTKTFHVEPCTWTESTVQEDVFLDALQPDAAAPSAPQSRPFMVAKTAPMLEIDSVYSADVPDGEPAVFTLEYQNSGGYENDVMIRNEFPAEAPFVSAVPVPDREAPDGSWVEWDLGDLANGAMGSIDVTVAIEAGLPSSTTIPITDTIYNHVGQPADFTVIRFHVLQLTLGDLVWYDTDQDGIQDPGEPGVQGILVDLYDDGACSDTILASDTTDAAGLYGFTDLQPGTYCLQFSNIPAGWSISPQDQGSDDAADSDADPATGQINDILIAANDDTQDMGVYAEGSIGNTVFCDANQNGVFDTGEGVAGVTASLYDDPGCDGAAINLLGTQDTVGDGQYLFNGLPVGPVGSPVCYVVTVDVADMGNCSSPLTPLEYAVPLDTASPDALGNDFGFAEPPPEAASIGDYVWRDANMNGIQDVGEGGIGGITVMLYNCAGGQLASTATTASGFYSFVDLQPGRYNVAFAAPTGYLFSPPNQGGNPALDSDADPSTGHTVCTSLDEGENDMTWDAGLYSQRVEPEPPPVVPEASTLLLLGSAASGLAGYVGLQLRARRRKEK